MQAAHIRPVASQGPDSVRNGLALTGTLHWLFDRGLLAIGEDLGILVSPQGLPDDLGRLLLGRSSKLTHLDEAASRQG